MSKKKAPALHERRGREDISTRPPRLAGSPIKLAGDARLHRLSLAADSCVNRKYYGGDPGVGQRARGFAHKPCHTLRSGGQASFPLGQILGSHEATLSAFGSCGIYGKLALPLPTGATLPLLRILVPVGRRAPRITLRSVLMGWVPLGYRLKGRWTGGGGLRPGLYRKRNS